MPLGGSLEISDTHPSLVCTSCIAGAHGFGAAQGQVPLEQRLGCKTQQAQLLPPAARRCGLHLLQPASSESCHSRQQSPQAPQSRPGRPRCGPSAHQVAPGLSSTQTPRFVFAFKTPSLGSSCPPRLCDDPEHHTPRTLLVAGRGGGGGDGYSQEGMQFEGVAWI